MQPPTLARLRARELVCLRALRADEGAGAAEAMPLGVRASVPSGPRGCPRAGASGGTSGQDARGLPLPPSGRQSHLAQGLWTAWLLHIPPPSALCHPVSPARPPSCPPCSTGLAVPSGFGGLGLGARPASRPSGCSTSSSLWSGAPPPLGSPWAAAWPAAGAGRRGECAVAPLVMWFFIVGGLAVPCGCQLPGAGIRRLALGGRRGRGGGWASWGSLWGPGSSPLLVPCGPQLPVSAAAGRRLGALHPTQGTDPVPGPSGSKWHCQGWGCSGRQGPFPGQRERPGPQAFLSAEATAAQPP